ncbi:hypothetical protein CYLTODRAFT_399503 [Cylindrobasidium torrendii FP15055 ss-10]|uniref:Uncharacterized protein n=1 Tax=Cylindrobasidium torrendii FP15055 ss-10 TaxID=1314674 RepID=A0A0D7B5X9_9AGAR|nr:hypothetical protein CYLTODRAFT_399503 [Cylindrobasidium torrendii FP15055 ss-10]
MLALSAVHETLGKILEPPTLHTAVIFTPAGQLVSWQSNPLCAKDDVHLVIGLSGDAWQGAREKGYGMVHHNHLGKILVVPVEDVERKPGEDKPPLMLLALNATDEMEWADMQVKGKALGAALTKSWSKHREHLTVPKPPQSSVAILTGSKRVTTR